MICQWKDWQAAVCSTYRKRDFQIIHRKLQPMWRTPTSAVYFHEACPICETVKNPPSLFQIRGYFPLVIRGYWKCMCWTSRYIFKNKLTKFHLLPLNINLESQFEIKKGHYRFVFSGCYCSIPHTGWLIKSGLLIVLKVPAWLTSGEGPLPGSLLLLLVVSSRDERG